MEDKYEGKWTRMGKNMVKEHTLGLMVQKYVGEWKDGDNEWSRNKNLD